MQVLSVDNCKCDYCTHGATVEVRMPVSDGGAYQFLVCDVHYLYVTMGNSNAIASRLIMATREEEKASIEWRKGMHAILRDVTIAAGSLD